MNYQEAYLLMSKVMDKRDLFYKRLKDFYINNGFVPGHRKIEFEIGKSEKFKPWKQQKHLVRRVKLSAKKASKNKGYDNLTEEKIIEIMGDYLK